jgi:hypothetical protein
MRSPIPSSRAPAICRRISPDANKRAIEAGWLWVGTDLSESVSLSEERLAVRLMADLAVVTSSLVVARQEANEFGFRPRTRQVELTLDYEMMAAVHEQTRGLSSDKVKSLLEFVWGCLERHKARGVILRTMRLRTWPTTRRRVSIHYRSF